MNRADTPVILEVGVVPIVHSAMQRPSGIPAMIHSAFGNEKSERSKGLPDPHYSDVAIVLVDIGTHDEVY